MKWGSVADELRALVGEAGLVALVARFGGRTLRIPTPRSAARHDRRARVHAALADGQTYRETATREGVALDTICCDAKRST